MSANEAPETLPEGEEAPPPGVRVMAWLRWFLVVAMAAIAGLSFARHFGLIDVRAEEGARYQCPMHPAVVQDTPGTCPICGMDLVPMAAGEKADGREREDGNGYERGHAHGDVEETYWCPMHPEVTSNDPNATCALCGGMKLVPKPRTPSGAVLELGGERIQRMGIRTAPVTRSAPNAALSAWGVIQAPDGRIGRLHTRASGYVEELFVKERGAWVKQGQPLLSFYSPELVAAQRELITTERWTHGGANASERDLSDAAREKLRTLGVTDADIEAIARERTPRHALVLRAPQAGFVSEKPIVAGSFVDAGALLLELTDLREVWVVADVPERALASLAVGMPARVRVPGEANAREATVTFVYPEVDINQRTAKLRVTLKNHDLRLRPGTSAHVELTLRAREGLYIPESAVLDAGERAYVFASRGSGRFEQMRVTLGTRAGDQVEVLEGLKEGDVVVTSAAFLLDAETRLQNIENQGTTEAPSAGAER